MVFFLLAHEISPAFFWNADRFLRTAFLHCESLEDLRREAWDATKDALNSRLAGKILGAVEVFKVGLWWICGGFLVDLWWFWLVSGGIFEGWRGFCACVSCCLEKNTTVLRMCF